MNKYYSKLPRQPFASKTRGFCRTIEAARKRIESFYAPGYTSEPYIQLVEEDEDGYRVLSEWMPGKGWTGPLQAAGFAPTPGVFA